MNYPFTTNYHELNISKVLTSTSPQCDRSVAHTPTSPTSNQADAYHQFTVDMEL